MESANRNVRRIELSKYKPMRSTLGPNGSYLHAVMTIDNNEQKSTLEAASNSWNRSYDNNSWLGSPLSSDKFFYFRVCLARTNSLLQFSYMSNPSDLLHMREDSFERSDCTARSIQFIFSRGCKFFLAGDDSMQSGSDRWGQNRRWTEGENVPVLEDMEQKTNSILVENSETPK